MVNYVAVLVVAVLNFGLGALWYGPLFGKKWISLMKLDPNSMDKSNMGLRYAGGFLTSLVTAFVLALFVGYTGAATVLTGATTALLLWLGFIATVTLGAILWENKPFALYVLNNAYSLVGLLIMGAILAVWV